ncbi:MAG: RHS repeat-associated core domain-containing protein, partial [Thermoanaerobaculales bacterium]|nr:RHS repeat-associated core domain-containing protein [Thermoanaerobaculales bacterium]
ITAALEAPRVTLETLETATASSQIQPENRFRLFEDLGWPVHPLELLQTRKTASGVFDLGIQCNVWQTGDLSQKCSSPSFQGLWHDPTSALAYARARWYDPRTAQWLSPDPMGAFDSENQYAFVAWAPNMSRDPEGLWAEDLVLGVPSLGLGAYSFWSNLKEGNLGMAAIDVFGMAVDTVAIALPGIPGGAGFGIKAGRAGLAMNRVQRGVEAAQYIDQTINIGQGLYQASGAFAEGDFLSGGLNLGMSMLGMKMASRSPWQITSSNRAGMGFGGVSLRRIEAPGNGSINAKNWRQYEAAIVDMTGGRQAYSRRKFTTFLDGKRVSGVADNVVRQGPAGLPIEAKFVKKWGNSIRNPHSPLALGKRFGYGRVIAKRERLKMVNQARKYFARFGGARYYSNNRELIAHYSKLFERLDIKGIEWVYAP